MAITSFTIQRKADERDDDFAALIKVQVSFGR